MSLPEYSNKLLTMPIPNEVRHLFKPRQLIINDEWLVNIKKLWWKERIKGWFSMFWRRKKLIEAIDELRNNLENNRSHNCDMIEGLNNKIKANQEVLLILLNRNDNYRLVHRNTYFNYNGSIEVEEKLKKEGYHLLDVTKTGDIAVYEKTPKPEGQI